MIKYSLLKLKLKHVILYQAYVEVWFPIFFTWLFLKLSLLYLFLPVLIYEISPSFSTCTTTVLPTSMSETFPSSNGSNGNSLMESYLRVLTEIFLYPSWVHTYYYILYFYIFSPFLDYKVMLFISVFYIVSATGSYL